MGMVRVVTDSTADLTPELIERSGVAVVPLSVSFGDTSYEDGVTIDAPTFFQQVERGARPTTSQPAPEAFASVYRRLAEEGADGIVSIQISSKLSGTCGSAARAAQSLREAGLSVPIEVIDSEQASLSMQFGVLAAAEAARSGKDLATVIAVTRDVLKRSSIFLVADDLGYLQRGGRIGQAQRVAGTLLKVKPIITLRDGAVVALDQPRTRRKAYERLAEYLRELAPVESLIVGQANEEVGDQLAEMVAQVYDGPTRRAWAGPTIGTHVGPGAAGIGVLRAG
ncbi:MAG: DegV family protein [Ktedonobacterales bacterium]